ncbi:DUF1131 family protein [Psychrobacillus sp. FSL H8-0483]|uniref:DUF1131 family protein n=1 Tax=Psychrobacillus sp. FSL H8-0483 TaxID=2921389 RepID=UPI00315B1164
MLLVGLVFVIFSFSTNSFAVKNDKSYEDDQVISVSDSLDDSYAVENDMSYEDGQIISVSDSLDNSYLTRNDIGYEDGQIISVSSEDKTIEVFYTNYSDISETYYYEEDSGEDWYRVIEIVKSLNGWFATFSGTSSALVN